MPNFGSRWAKVVGIHPEAFAVDLLLLEDGQRIPCVQVLTPSGSTNTGLNDLVNPTLSDAGNPYDPTETKDRDIYAKVSFVGNKPVVDGFLFPQVCQLLFTAKNFKVTRHASDFYSTIDADGNVEHYHPSGTYFRIGTASAHNDLTATDFDKKWAITKNTDTAVYAHLEVHNAGTLKATIDIDPNGNITITNAGNLLATVTGDAQISAANIVLDAPVTETTGDLVVGTGASGTFTTPMGQTVTVQDGIVTNIY